MWKKSLAFAGVIGLIVLLDPVPGPAQPPGGKGDRKGFGGFGGPPGGGMGGPPGGGFGGKGDRGSFGQPPSGTPGVVVVQPGGDGAMQPRGMGGPPGGGMGGPPRGMDPERGWMMLQRATQSSGDTIDLGKMDPQVRNGIRMMTERMGGIPLPESGVWTKDQYMDHFTRSEAARNAAAAGGGMTRTPDANTMSMDRGRFGDRGPGGWGDPNGGGWGGGWGGPPGGWGDRGDQRPPEKKETEEERPVAMRYGKLPKDLPGWFDELDGDKDGQVGLYEWRRASKSMTEFKEMDLNGDGFITADEYLRYGRQKNIDTKIAAFEETGERPSSFNLNGPSASGDKGRGPGGPGGRFGPPSGDKGGSRDKPSESASDKTDKDKSDKDKGNDKDKGGGGPGRWRPKG